MTIVNLHGILGQEYGKTFKLNLSNPRHVLEAIDCNRTGFLRRVIDLYKDGLGYEIIVNRKKLSQPSDVDNIRDAKTIDLVPIITGSTGLEVFLLAGLEKAFFAIVFATIQYALTPKPAVDSLEIQADAGKTSLVFSNRVNIASQGSPVPVGYGRLKVGTQVIQATIKSYPQYSDPNYVLTDGRDVSDLAFQTNVREDRNVFLNPDNFIPS